MSPKVKMYVYYSLSFLVLYAIGFFILTSFTTPTTWTRFIPIVLAYIFSFKPYIEETHAGRRYGLKSLFSKKIWILD